jgi:hypothetical protein
MKIFNSFHDLKIFQKEKSKSEMKINLSQTIFIFRSMNYSTGHAFCDLIDNSIDAGAKNIEVKYMENPEDGKLLIYIKDDGKGLDEIEIEDGYTIGAVQNNRKKNSLGKFGIGMKLSSLSKADVVSMFSKAKNKEPVHRTLSWEKIKKSQKVELLKNYQDSISIDMDKIIENNDWDDNDKSGTILLLTKIRKHYDTNSNSSKSDHTKELKYLKSFISRTYEYHLKEKLISINFNHEFLKPIDPFYTDMVNSIKPRLGYQEVKTFINFKGSPIEMNMILIPPSHYEKITIHHSYDRLKNIEKFDKIPQPAIYIYRNNRLISCDGWANANNRTHHSSLYCVRISIKLNSSFDENCGLDPQKTSYEFPQDLKDLIVNKIEEKRKEWRYKGKQSATFFDSGRDKNVKIKTSRTPTSRTPTSRTPTSRTPSTQTPSTQTPTSQTPTSQTPTSQTPTSQTPSTQTPTTPSQNERGKQVQIIFKPFENTTDLLWYDEGEVVINNSHEEYGDFMNQMKKIINEQ